MVHGMDGRGGGRGGGGGGGGGGAWYQFRSQQLINENLEGRKFQDDIDDKNS